jgi:hypothetical protein
MTAEDLLVDLLLRTYLRTYERAPGRRTRTYLGTLPKDLFTQDEGPYLRTRTYPRTWDLRPCGRPAEGLPKDLMMSLWARL